MRHRNRGRKLGLRTAPRMALLRQLVESLFLHGRVRTTITRAKEARRIAERLVTWAKRGSLHHRRLALAVLYRPDVVDRLFSTVVEWYRNRAGGYTRIIKLGTRAGDGAPLAFLELVDWIPGEKLTGQLIKVVKAPEGEEGKEGKEAKAEKGKKETAPKKPEPKKAKAPAKAEEKPKTAQDHAKDKKKAERKAALEKVKQERAASREKRKQEHAARRSKAGEHKAAGKTGEKHDKGGKK
jgi:large subunit ribosomal protein L17